MAAGTMILAMLAALQAWRARVRGGSWPQRRWRRWRLLSLDGRLRCRRGRRRIPLGRRPARVPAHCGAPLFVSLTTFVIARVVVSPSFATPHHHNQGPRRVAMEIGPALAHSAQAICEALVFNNLGLDAVTTATQAFVIALVLAALWAWSLARRDPSSSRPLPRVNPLEAAGAVLVAASFGMIFAVRGTEATFDGLRAGWYDAMPELGAILFVSGWWAGHIMSPPPKAVGPPLRGELLVVVLFAAVMLVLQTPRVNRVIFQYDGLSAP